MLYLLHMGNHPELSYRGGQGPIVHLEGDLEATTRWAKSAGAKWAFSLSNAGAAYAEFRRSLGPSRRRGLGGRRQLGLQVASGQGGQAGGVPRSAILPVAPRRARWRPRCADPSSGDHRTVGCRASAVGRRPPPLVLLTRSWSSTHMATSFKLIPGLRQSGAGADTRARPRHLRTRESQPEWRPRGLTLSRTSGRRPRPGCYAPVWLSTRGSRSLTRISSHSGLSSLGVIPTRV